MTLFMPENIYRTHHCGQLTAKDVGQNVRLSGWIHRKRDHGGVLFIEWAAKYRQYGCVFRGGVYVPGRSLV